MKARLPKTTDEWQRAVDIAEFWIHFHSARLYGLVSGGPEVDVDRCQEILRLGARINVYPAADAVERCTKELLSG